MFGIYEVGGAVRDRLMGIRSKDFDYVVVVEEMIGEPAEIGYGVMKSYLIDKGFTIFQENPNCLTIRCKFPIGHVNYGITADFVLAREEQYNEFSRIPSVRVGSLKQDLERRDFTVNAIACTTNGMIIDPFNGRAAIANKLLDTPVHPWITFTDDPLRALRAIRFSVTKGFEIASRVREAFEAPELVVMTNRKVSVERIREELLKAFKFDTIRTFEALMDVPKPLRDCWINSGGLWLKPTLEK